MDEKRSDGKPKPAPAKEDRLAEALRANLRRRKEAARQVEPEGDAEGEREAGGGGDSGSGKA